MEFLTEKDEEGSDRVIVPSPVIVVEATVMRITGAGNLVVYPDRQVAEAHEGSRVIVLNSSGNNVKVSLEVIKERVTLPYASNLTLVVGARRRVEKCNVWFDGRKLLGQDSTGASVEELALPVGGYLYFRVPEEMIAKPDSIVEVRDEAVTLRRERYRNIIGATEIVPRRHP